MLSKSDLHDATDKSLVNHVADPDFYGPDRVEYSVTGFQTTGAGALG